MLGFVGQQDVLEIREIRVPVALYILGFLGLQVLLEEPVLLGLLGRLDILVSQVRLEGLVFRGCLD